MDKRYFVHKHVFTIFSLVYVYLTASLITPRYLGLMILGGGDINQVNSGQYFFFRPIVTQPS
jgi:hypothetical protein